MFSVLILLNDADDKFLTDHVIEELELPVKALFIFNSNEVFKYLEKDPLPQLILLDSNSKPENALQIIKSLKASTTSSAIPVVILTDSSDSKYTRECYASGASSVVKKPASYEETASKIKNFFSYWIDVAAH